MNREQVKQELLKGRVLEELFEFRSGQGCDIYKGEFSLYCLEQCGGKEELAKELFWYCDWQHPSSAWYGDFLWDMEE